MARIITKHMSEQLGQSFVVENRPGADSLIGTQYVANADANGYTILVASGSHSINASMYPQTKVHPVDDFEHIGMIGDATNFLVVHPSLPVETAEEFVSYARERPGEINCSTSASTTFLATELFKTMAKVDIQSIPYKGAGPATMALLSGEVHCGITSLVGMLPHVKGGKMRALAVTSAKPSPLAPDVPTLTEKAVPDYVASTWYAVFAPANTPAPVVQTLNAALNEALMDPDVRSQLEAQGVEVIRSSSDELRKFVSDETEKWARVVRESKVQTQK